MKKSIGEEITTNYEVFVVALPRSNDEFIRVSPFAFSVLEGKIYFDDNTVEQFDVMKSEREAIETAKSFMLNTNGWEFTTVYGVGTENGNNRLRKKLEQFTRFDFFNKSY